MQGNAASLRPSTRLSSGASIDASRLTILWQLWKRTVRVWLDDNASRLGAALAFYSILSMGPLLLIVIAIAGLAFGQEAASGHIFAEIRGLVGNDGADAIQNVIAHSRNQEQSLWATLAGVVMLMVAATGFFGQLQDALNFIWKVKARPESSMLRIVRKRIFSFAMIIGIGFLLLISLVISAALAAMGNFFDDKLPEVFLHVMNLVVSFATITVFFAMVFCILPDARVRWRDVWMGAAITAMLFSIGKLLIGLYLGHSALGSTYGAAGSFIVILIWVYYSTQILFLGAEFTKVHAEYRGAKVKPMRGAVKQPEATSEKITQV